MDRPEAMFILVGAVDADSLSTASRRLDVALAMVAARFERWRSTWQVRQRAVEYDGTSKLT